MILEARPSNAGLAGEKKILLDILNEDIAEPDAFIANMPSAVEVVTAPAEKAADLSAG